MVDLVSSRRGLQAGKLGVPVELDLNFLYASITLVFNVGRTVHFGRGRTSKTGRTGGSGGEIETQIRPGATPYGEIIHSYCVFSKEG